MNNILYVSFFISVIYLIVQFINKNFIEKDPKSIKVLIKDTLLVFVSINLGDFLLNQITPGLTQISETTINKSVEAFTGEPEF
tara:strand:- start:63 stop:311 length:249 start_codon:yes stop_codon:yes gene_type:complete